MPIDTLFAENGAGRFSQTTLGAVPCHSVADFFGTRIPNSDPVCACIATARHLQYKSGHGDPSATCGALKVAPMRQYSERIVR